MCPSPGKPFLAGSWVLANQPLPREEVTSANSQRAYRHGAASYQKTVLPPQPSATSTNLIQRLLICPTLETKKNYTAAESEILQQSQRSCHLADTPTVFSNPSSRGKGSISGLQGAGVPGLARAQRS